MTIKQRISDEKEKADELTPEEIAGITCRCEEVSKKTISEMLRLMLGDLAFWKKKEQK